MQGQGVLLKMLDFTDQDHSEISKEGLVGTILFHALLLLLFLLLGLQSNWTQPQEGGIMLNFGTDEAGWGDVQPMSDASDQSLTTDLVSPAPESSPPPAPATQPQPSDKQSVLTGNDDEAPAMTKDDKKKDTRKDAPKDSKNTNVNNKDNGKNTNSPSNAQTPASKPAIDPNSLFKGSQGNNATSQGNTPGGTGDEGHRMGGADISNNTGGNGGNSSGGVAANVPGRKLLSVPPISDSSQDIGTVVIKIKVNRQGDVIEAKYTSQGSTTTSSTLTSKAAAAAKKSKFNAELNAPEVQNGTMTFRFKVK